jgi:N-acetyl-gamma-glutamyl-phosphate reductase
MTVKLFIDGASGTTGIDIRDRLSGRQDIVLQVLPEQHRKDPSARRDALNAADAVLLCLPDDAAREAVGLIENAAVKVIDASTAHRIASGWAYGFAELEPGQRQLLSTASRISNPGCYPTGFLALVRPLVREGLLPADWPYTVNAISGYSGGGKTMIAEFEQSAEPGSAQTAFRIYGLALAHKHVPEMQQHGGLMHPPLFAPAVARTYSGMIVEIPLQLTAMPTSATPAALREALAAAYEGSRIISVQTGDELAVLALERCAGTDRLELFVFANSDGSQVRLVAVLDNLGKGAGGAAVQNLNIAMGLEETVGLRL